MGKTLAFAFILAIGFAATVPASAAPLSRSGAASAENAYAAALKARGKREVAQANCMQRAETDEFRPAGHSAQKLSPHLHDAAGFPAALKHDPEKCAAVFRKIMRTQSAEAKKTHPALARSPFTFVC